MRPQKYSKRIKVVKQMNKKLEILKELFKDADRILVAFSGGVDSSFLLYALKNILSLDVKAVTIKTTYIPDWEVKEARDFCTEYSIEHIVLDMPFPMSILKNPEDRCYRCKKILFSRIKEYALDNNIKIIADGSNADDISDHRPGMKALNELKIISPLLEAGITKDDIRKQLKLWGLRMWDKPAYACLLTRIPHNTLIDEAMLKKIEEGELFIKELGFPGTRLRLQGDIARLEANPIHIEQISHPDIRGRITAKLKSLGIKYITLDLEGYKMGSLNIINKK